MSTKKQAAMGQASTAQIVSHVLGGVKSAFSNYSKMSGGDYLGTVPESYIQAEIANSLFKNLSGKVYISIEESYSTIFEWAGFHGNVVNNLEHQNKRADIVVWHLNATPRFIIEIKRFWEYNALDGDASRIRYLLGLKNELKGGLLVCSHFAKNNQTFVRRHGKLEKRLKIPLYDSLERKVPKKDYYWGAGCFLLKK